MSSAPYPGKWARILALHDQTQSSASFRACLKPILDRLPSGYHVHFLEAPFAVVLPEDAGASSSAAAKQAALDWQSAAQLASLIDAIDSEPSDRLSEDSRSLKSRSLSRLQGSDIGKAVLEAMQKGGMDEVESLVGRKSGRSLDRDWSVPADPTGASKVRFGLHKSLAYIGDYVREHGPFHGLISCGSGSPVATLLQSLLFHPRSSSTQWPSFFPLLPTSVKPPRMGGWEAVAPPSDTLRTARGEALQGRHLHPPSPAGFSLHVHAESALDFLGQGGAEWVRRLPPSAGQGHKGEESWSAEVCLGGKSRLDVGARGDGAEHKVFRAKEGEILPENNEVRDQIAAWIKLAAAASQGDVGAQSRLARGGHELETEAPPKGRL